MPIDRTAFNAMLDDDGTGEVGTMWNKPAIASAILDPADAAYAGKYDTFIERNDTGVQNGWAPGLNGHTFIIWYGAGDLTLNGMGGGHAGQRVTIRNVGGSGAAIFVYYISGSAPAGLRFQIPTTSGPLIIGTLGWATFVYDSAQGMWSVVAHEQGAWIPVPFSAANFATYSGMAWTVTAGQVVMNRYRVSGRTMTWALSVLGSTLSGTASNIAHAQLPSGFQSVGTGGQQTTAGLVQLYNGGAWQSGYGALGFVALTHLEILTASVGNFALGTPFHVLFTLSFELQ